MRLGSISIYPVKATAPVTVSTAAVELAGLRDDRRWAVVDARGRRLNATTHDRLLSVTATPDGVGGLMLTRLEQTPLVVPAPVDGREIPVDVSRLATMMDAGDAAADWFSQVLGEPVRLAWQDDPARRPIAAAHGGRGAEPLNLADTAPILLTTAASLAQLDAWIAADHEPQPMTMGRFRPNVVIEGSEVPFAEDSWQTVRIGDVEHRFAELCDRCVVTTIEPGTLAHGKEPIRTLARHRRWDGKTWFGVRLVPLTTGTITIGDPVTVS